jgi:hypothetical protein
MLGARFSALVKAVYEGLNDNAANTQHMAQGKWNDKTDLLQWCD